MKKGVGSGVGSGSGFISQKYGSGDPDPHQNVTDPQHWPHHVQITAREGNYGKRSMDLSRGNIVLAR
jgi:hypothetical protein